MTVYGNVHVLIQLLQIELYVYCYIQGRHTESDIRSQGHLTDIAYCLHRRSLAVHYLLSSKSWVHIFLDNGALVNMKIKHLHCTSADVLMVSDWGPVFFLNTIKEWQR